MGYASVRRRQLTAPLGRDTPDGFGQKFQNAIGDIQDAEDVVLKGGVKARFAHLAPDDALPLVSFDRTIEQAPIEANDDFRVRITQAPDLNKWIGTRRGIQQIFSPYGYALEDVHVFNNCDVAWDDNTYWFSRVFLMLESGYFTSDGLWSDPGDWDDGGVWDSNATIEDVGYFRREIRRCKAPSALPIVIAVALSADGFWDSDGVYDDGGDWDTPSPEVTFIPLFDVWDEDGDDVWGDDDTDEVWKDDFL